MIEQLHEALRDAHLAAGNTAVTDVQVRRGPDSSGESAIFIDLTLSNPAQSGETWPVEDIWELRRKIRNVVWHVYPEDFDLPWFVSLQPEEPGELAPEDADAEVPA